MAQRFPIFAAIGLIGLSLALHALFVLVYGLGPDRLAMLALVPRWAWAAAGVVCAVAASWFRRSPAALVLCVLWGVTLLSGENERRAATGWLYAAPAPEPREGVVGTESLRLRVISFNTDHFQREAADEVLRWHPDIVLFQESPFPSELNRLGRELFGDESVSAFRHWCGIVARGRSLDWFQMQFDPAAFGGGQPRAIFARLTLPDGRPLDLLNVHLLSAERCVSVWSPACWQAHTSNRRQRRHHLDILLETREWIAGSLPPAPSIIAGDFNAPAGDASLERLAATHVDAFAAAGRGYGATYHNRWPIHRIDQIWLGSELAPLGARTVRSVYSDHRMVVADFLYPR